MTLIFLRIFVNDKLKNIVGRAINNGIRKKKQRDYKIKIPHIKQIYLKL